MNLVELQRAAIETADRNAQLRAFSLRLIVNPPVLRLHEHIGAVSCKAEARDCE